MRCLNLFRLLLVGLCSTPAPAAASKILKTITVDHPAFLHLAPGRTPGTSELLISSFAFFGSSTVSHLTLGPDANEDAVLGKPEVVTAKVRWPNAISTVPDSVFGPGYVSIGTGFLTPTYTTGQVLITNIYSNESFALSVPKRDFFYHRVIWADMNDDGRLDALTARAKKSLFGGSAGELVWFEQPKGLSKGPWLEHIIAEGPDVNFVTADLNHDGAMEIIATEFFGAKLSILWREGDAWQRRVIDDHIGAAFDLSLVDLNNDGRLDLLVTNHMSDARASIFGYDIPTDYKAGEFKRHALLSGILTKIKGPNQASPGTAIAWPTQAGKKPNIVAAGDGSGQVHLLKPASDDSDDWAYTAESALNTTSTIGGMALGSPQVDGSTPLYVPAYDEGKIYILKLEP